MPVVPAVYSTTVPRGESRPSAAAHSIIALAMRSFILPVGFADSNLTTTRAEPAGTTLRSRSEEHTSELQSRLHLVCRLLLEKKKKHEFDGLVVSRNSSFSI